jgi:hypothetical protein
MHQRGRIPIDFQYLVQHVATRAGNIIRRRLRGESGFGTQCRFIDDQLIQLHQQIGLVVVRCDIALHIMADDHMIVTDTCEGAGASYFKYDQRFVRIHMQDISPLCLCLSIRRVRQTGLKINMLVWSWLRHIDAACFLKKLRMV